MRPHQFLKFSALSSLAISAAFASAQGGSFGAQHPFDAPDATVQNAPERMYDLQNLVLEFNVDYPNRLLTATSINSIEAIKDGVTQLRFHAGKDTKVESVELNGHTATFTRDDLGILVDCPATKKGEKDVVTVHYHLKQSEIKNGGGGGWHWHEPKKNDPAKVGFWTNGESEDTRDWAVTWDYPNDFTTTETRTTVPKEWTVIGNGVQVSDKDNADGNTHTVIWRMTQPHATYLTSVLAGPLDVKKDTWRGVPLMYVAPKGKGKLLDYTFGHTKDMLSFFSDNLGVKYPWPKYAQDCTYDFGGGQENVSATTLGETFLTDPRDGYYSMDSLNSHEMGHQWFGDYVTCKDWGQIWLNESFATVMEMEYTLHSEGLASSQREFESYSRQYLAESRRYKRPLSTNFYQNPEVMFDEDTYSKGGCLLFSLQKLLGDKQYYAGLHRYLTLHHNSPVETMDLCNAMSEATGIDLHPWFNQWILKPGHPVIDWSWDWDTTAKKVKVHVKQTQDTSKGVPIYDIPAKVAFIDAAGKIIRLPIHLNSADQTFDLATSTKPAAVLFDPDHEFLREIPKQPWAKDELMSIARFAPDAVSRQDAMNRILAESPSDEDVQTIVAMLRKDRALFPAILSTARLAALNKPELREFWEAELDHESVQRRAEAVSALAALPNDANLNNTFRNLLNDKQPYRVVAAAINALSKYDYADSAALIKEQAAKSDNGQIQRAALNAIVSHDQQGAADYIFMALGEMQPDGVQSAGFEALGSFKGDDPRILPAVRNALNSGQFGTMFGALRIARERKMKELIPDLEELKKRSPRAARFVDSAIKEIQGS